MIPFELNPQDIFKERRLQLKGWGIPPAWIMQVESSVSDCWTEGPGGWVHEWMLKAAEAEEKRLWLLASACSGAARFPVPCTPSRKIAQERQLEFYLRAARAFPLHFERRILEIPFRGETTPVAAHIFNARPDRDLPLLCVSGGVDTYKMEIHRLLMILAKFGDFRVIAIDMPGTGESRVALGPDSEQIYLEVLRVLQKESRIPVRTGVLGMSFGGLWSAKLALRREVDASVNLGGPVGFSPFHAPQLRALPNGMAETIAHAMGLGPDSTDEVIREKLDVMLLAKQGLLSLHRCSRLLVLNGEWDQYIPREETEGFRDFPDATVWTVKGTTHCAVERFARLLPSIVAWLRKELHEPGLKTDLIRTVARAVRPTLLPPSCSRPEACQE